jgi:ribosomal protein S18 acetylase RimI-like enzyme
VAVLFVPPPRAPDGWEELVRMPTRQMVADSVAAIAATNAAVLGPDDVDDMLDLVARTQPGPFERRTIELGQYIGIRDDDGALIAMAGMRMRLPGYTEISAVCTDERMRGSGLASALVRDLVGRVRDDGDVAMLHVVSTNVNAIRVYDQLGFTTRHEKDVTVLRAPA